MLGLVKPQVKRPTAVWVTFLLYKKKKKMSKSFNLSSLVCRVARGFQCDYYLASCMEPCGKDASNPSSTPARLAAYPAGAAAEEAGSNRYRQPATQNVLTEDLEPPLYHRLKRGRI